MTLPFAIRYWRTQCCYCSQQLGVASISRICVLCEYHDAYFTVYQKYQRRKMPLRTPRIIALFFLSVLIICYILNAVFRKSARSWYPLFVQRKPERCLWGNGTVCLRKWGNLGLTSRGQKRFHLPILSFSSIVFLVLFERQGMMLIILWFT